MAAISTSSFWLRRGQINSCLPLGQKNHVEIVSSELDPNANWPFGGLSQLGLFALLPYLLPLLLYAEDGNYYM